MRHRLPAVTLKIFFAGLYLELAIYLENIRFALTGKFVVSPPLSLSQSGADSRTSNNFRSCSSLVVYLSLPWHIVQWMSVTLKKKKEDNLSQELLIFLNLSGTNYDQYVGMFNYAA